MNGAVSRVGILAITGQLALAGACGGELDQCLDAAACGPCMTCRNGACEPVDEPCDADAVCAGITCGGAGTCVVVAGAPSCDCDPDHHAVGLVCVPDVAGCAGELCSGHGVCLEGVAGPYCDCSGGFHAEGLTCVADAPSTCVSTREELQAALTAAEGNGQDDVIRVVQGTYVGVFVYYSTEASALTVEGGYASGCAGRVVDATNTVLSAGGTGGVLSLVSPAAADLAVDGLTLREGLATYGGGLYVATSGDVAVIRSVITANRAGQGGGLFVKGANLVVVSDCTLSDNDFGAGEGDGGGMNLSEVTAAVVSRNVVAGNAADGSGGGVFVGAEFAGTTNVDDVTITGNVIRGNVAGYGGGIAVVRSFFTGAIAQVTIANNLVIGNSAEGYTGYEGSSGGGIRIENASRVSLLENTVVDNRAGQQGGGLRLIIEGNADSADVYNNIIWGNSASTEGADVDIDNDGEDLGDGDGVRSTVNLLCNDFDRTSPTGFQVDIPISIDASNLANVDPLFTAAAAGDFALGDASQCVDACAKNGVPDVDQAGTTRPQGSGYDMGALEAVP